MPVAPPAMSEKNSDGENPSGLLCCDGESVPFRDRPGTLFGTGRIQGVRGAPSESSDGADGSRGICVTGL